MSEELTAEDEALLRSHAARPGYSMASKVIGSLDASRASEAKLLDALTFYADNANWRARGHPQIDADTIPAYRDRGALARNAIRPHPWCADPIACRAAGRCPLDPVCGN